jgi:hypothetical protein
MPLESVSFIEDFNDNWPTGTDPKNEGDNHIRNVKKGILDSFPNTSGPWNTTSQISMGGATMQGQTVEAVGDPVNDTDAVNQQTMIARTPGFISWGAVGSGGTNTNSTGSADWTVTRLALGHYRLTFNRPVSGGGTLNAGFVGTPIASADDWKLTAVSQVNSVDVDVHMWAGNGNAADGNFSFIRMVL